MSDVLVKTTKGRWGSPANKGKESTYYCGLLFTDKRWTKNERPVLLG